MLGLRFSRLVHAALASGALVLGACTGDGDQTTDGDTSTSTTSSDTDDPTGVPIDPPPRPPPPPPPSDITPPALVSVTLLDPHTLQLSFTEPVAPVDTVNPKRFRLSFAHSYEGGNYGGQPGTYLVDPRYYNYQELCPAPPPACYYYPAPDYCNYGPYCYYQTVGPILVSDLINHPDDPNAVLASLTAPILPTLCNVIESFKSQPNRDAVLHLHYADGGLAQITDLASLPLPGLGEQWVKYSGNFFSYPGELFGNFDPFVPIPCSI